MDIDRDTDAPAPFARRLKRAIVAVMIVSFSVAAVGGIIVLLGDVWSQTAGQVLATTVITGVISIAVFCGTTLAGRPIQWFGFLTVAVSIGTLALLLALIWNDSIVDRIGWEWLPTAAVLTTVGAISSLILLLVRHRSWLVRVALALTLGLIVLGTTLTLIIVWSEAGSDLDWLVRLVGIVWILAALGTIVVPVSTLLLRRPSPRGPAEPAPPEEEVLSPASLDRISSAASAAGISPDELIERVLDSPDGTHGPSA